MSGISGIVHFDGRPTQVSDIKAMTAAMAHRGPDGIHNFVRGSIALGHCMLRTTPESLEEIQPLSNEDESLVIVADARVDNWEELRSELLSRGARLRTRADVELVLHAYETWGVDCISHIEGDFAFAIFDERKRELFCARDPLGNKPFHYLWTGETLAFATDVRALLALPFACQEINEDMVAEFIAGDWYAIDETFWKGVRKLPPARILRGTAGGARVEKYWEPVLSDRPLYKRDEEYVEHFRALFADNVRKASRSHRPLACEVSGGLDSSSIFCMAYDLRRQDHFLAPDLHGFTIAFEGDPRADEREYARAVGRHCATLIEESPPSYPSASWFQSAAERDRDFPGYPNMAASLNMLDAMSSKGCRVALNGEGGDEWTGGNRYYYFDDLRAGHFLSASKHFCTDAEECGAVEALKYIISFGVLPFFPQKFQHAAYSVYRSLRSGPVRIPDDAWLSNQLKDRIKRRRQHFQSDTCSPDPGRFAMLETLNYPFATHVTEYHERLRSRYGIEPRSPLRNRQTVEFAFATPHRLRLSGKENKLLLRKALRVALPEELLRRTGKSELSVTFRNHLRVMRGFFCEQQSELPDWVLPESLAALYEEVEEQPGGRPLWPLWGVFGCTCLLNSE